MDTASELASTHECPYCKQPIANGAIKCPHCRSRISGEADKPAARPARSVRVKHGQVAYITDKGIIHYLKLAGGLVAVVISVTAFILGVDFENGRKDIDEGRRQIDEARRQIEENTKTLHENVQKVKAQAAALEAQAAEASAKIKGVDTDLKDLDRVLELRVGQILAKRSSGLSEGTVRDIVRETLAVTLPRLKGTTDPAAIRSMVDEAAKQANSPEADEARRMIGEQLAYAIDDLNARFGGKRTVPRVEMIDEAKHDAYLDDEGKTYWASPQARNIPDTAYHNMAHPYIDETAKLVRSGQPGAIFESYADILATLIKQKRTNTTAETGDWVFAPGAAAWAANEDVAKSRDRTPLRSLKNPGEAFKNHPVLGTDAQPDKMSELYQGDFDSGGIHINSGIPSKAFYQVAMVIGTERAGTIWLDGLKLLLPESDFGDLATCTMQAAGAKFGTESKEQKAVRLAWESVGVIASPAGANSGGSK